MSQTEPLSQFVSEILEMWEANSSKNFPTLNSIQKELQQCLYQQLSKNGTYKVAMDTNLMAV
jgi:hypothetical protein